MPIKCVITWPEYISAPHRVALRESHFSVLFTENDFRTNEKRRESNYKSEAKHNISIGTLAFPLKNNKSELGG